MPSKQLEQVAEIRGGRAAIRFRLDDVWAPLEIKVAAPHSVVLNGLHKVDVLLWVNAKTSLTMRWARRK